MNTIKCSSIFKVEEKKLISKSPTKPALSANVTSKPSLSSSHIPPPVQVQRLLNQGNTCFVNSALQALASFDLFFDYLNKIEDNEKCEVTHALLDDLRALKNPQSDYARRATLNSVASVKDYFLDSMEQHDSSEFIAYLMDWIDTEIRGTIDVLQQPDILPKSPKSDRVRSYIQEKNNYLLTKEGGGYVCTRKRNPRMKSLDPSTDEPTSPARFGYSEESYYQDRKLDTLFQDNPFSGILKSSLKCQYGHSSDTYSNFLHVSVPINYGDLESCFGEFATSEWVDYSCEECNGVSRSSKKQLSIAHPPDILCVHFQRLTKKNSSYGFGAKKVDKFVEYGLKFNISPYCSASLSGERSKPILYDLRAIIVHIGGSMGGHYVTYKRYQKSSWVYISDNEWHEVSEYEALRKPAFMLFYSRSDAS